MSRPITDVERQIRDKVLNELGLIRKVKPMENLEQIMWAAYSKQAGGKTFDGKPLPTWEELGEERQACWIAAAEAARAAMEGKDD